MVRAAVLGLAVGIVAVVAASGRASVHHPQEPFAVPVNAAGAPETLEFRAFANRRAALMNVANTKFPLDDPDPKKGRTIRGRVKDEIDRLEKLHQRTALESVTLAVDLLRYRRIGEADEPLRGQRGGFLPNITLAHVAAAQGEWGRAAEFLSIANEEPPPKQFPGLTPEQLAWQIKINRGPLRKLFQLRYAESKVPKRTREDEMPDRIFDVNFVNAAGAYEPGVLAPAERAKLPPDALAIVQQLVLWFPQDTRLYWLLGELYAAQGEFATAEKIMDECVWSLEYGNRKALMQHREAVTKAAKAQGSAAPDEPLLAPVAPAPPPEPGPPPPATPVSMLTVGIYFGAVAAIALFALVRAMMKKRKSGTGGPIG